MLIIYYIGAKLSIMAQLVYSEKQQFLSKKSFYLALALELLLVLEITYQISANPNLRLSTSVLFLLGSSLFILTAILWFLQELSLKIKITNKGLSFKMAPFHLKQRKLKWQQIADYKIVSDPNLLSWSTDIENSWQEKKFTLNARHGIALTTVQGQHLFIGSSNLQALKEAIESGVAKYKAKLAS